MGKFDDETLYQPGGSGLIKFPEQVFWSLQGDKQRADAYRGAALQLKASLDAGNGQGVAQCSVQRKYDDGTVIDVRKAYNFYYLTIFSPLGKHFQPWQEPVDIPVLQPGQFYYVPGCKARYSFKYENLQNEIYVVPGTVDSSIDMTNNGYGAELLSLKDAGLSPLLPSPDGSISRNAKVCYLQGTEPDTGYSGARLEMSPYNLPASGAFSVSTLVRLRKPIEMDYSFTSKTQELDCDYTIYNPIKPRILASNDGDTWSAVCPGSAVPLIGWHIPSPFSNHWVRLTYPWPSYNDDFLETAGNGIGFREIGTVCDGEPLLMSDYAPDSPYWDKVTTGTLKTYDGEFSDFFEKNTEVNNSAPYESGCTFTTPYKREISDGTRVVAVDSDGENVYGRIYSSSYNYQTVPAVDGAGGAIGDEITLNGVSGTVAAVTDTEVTLITETVFILYDYQYKNYLVNAVPTVTFGPQPFPVNNSQGYLIGINFLGLLWYNGNKILAGKICDFETEYNLSPIVTDELEIGVFYHVCLTMDTNGNACLYLTQQGDSNTVIYKSVQSTEDFVYLDKFGDTIKLAVGADTWVMKSSWDAVATDYTSYWEFSSYMDVTMKRFYHHALTKEEAVLLSKEAFGQAFVADDDEAAQLQGKGMIAVVV